jgi:hydroxypyruvate reductase
MAARPVLVTSPIAAKAPPDFLAAYETFTPPNDVEAFLAGPGAETEVIVSGGEPLSAALLCRLPRLRLVACVTTGYELIETDWLKAHNVALTTAAGQNAHDVADLAVALALALWHRLPRFHAQVVGGLWRQAPYVRRSLRGARAGVVGFGWIGKAVAARLAAHEMDVAWWGPTEKPAAPYPRASSLLELARQSDLLVVAARSGAETEGLIDAAVFDALGPEGLLVNVARGTMIVEEDLQAALREGRLGGAGLDVFQDEPVDERLWRDVPNTILTPHIGGATAEGFEAMLWQVEENLRRYFAGEPLLSPVAL